MPDDVANQTFVMRTRRWWQILDRFPLADPPGPEGLHFVGSGSIDFLCGHCSAVLARAMSHEDLAKSALRCPRCHHWNITEGVQPNNVDLPGAPSAG